MQYILDVQGTTQEILVLTYNTKSHSVSVNNCNWAANTDQFIKTCSYAQKPPYKLVSS